MTLTLEDPRRGEAAALVAELVSFLDRLYPEDGEEAAAPWTLDDAAQRFLVAWLEGRAVGCGGLVPCAEDGAVEIVRMYVRPGARGRGIADQLLAALESAGRAGGARSILLRCGPRQPGALRLYERNGYVRRRPFAHHREHPTNIFYGKDLG